MAAILVNGVLEFMGPNIGIGAHNTGFTSRRKKMNFQKRRKRTIMRNYGERTGRRRKTEKSSKVAWGGGRGRGGYLQN
jgi:hypothetical protein